MLGWEVIPRIPLGDFSISPHGVGIAVGYFLGATLMARRARRTGFDEDHAWNAAVVGVLGAIVGARAAYILGHSAQFSSPIEYLQIYKGGISLAGGLIGGFLAAWIYCRAKKLDFLRLADLAAPGLAIGTAVGRIGDLVIGDHLGKTTDGFWGWEYQGGELISRPPCDPAVYPSADGCIEPGMVVHQTALYDSIWALVIFLILMLLDRRPRRKGFLVFTWAALYSIGRIVTDFTRVDKTWFGTGLTGSQLTAIAVLLLSAVALARLRKPALAPGGEPGEPAEAVAAAESSESSVEPPEAAEAGAPSAVSEPEAAATGEAEAESPAGPTATPEQTAGRDEAPPVETAAEIEEPAPEPAEASGELEPAGEPKSPPAEDEPAQEPERPEP